MLSLKVPFVCTLPLPLECVRAWARASLRHFKEQCLSVVQSAVTRHTLQAAPLHRFDSVIPHTAWRGPLNFYLLIKITKLLSTVCPSYHQGRYKLPLTMAVEYIAAIATKKSFSPPRGSLSSKTSLQRELPTRPRRSDTNQCFLGWGGEDQSKSKMLYAPSAENEADYVESDGNLSPFFLKTAFSWRNMRSDCIPSAKNATDPSVVCENAGSEFFRTACPSFSEPHKTQRQHSARSTHSLNQDRLVRYMSSGCRIML